MAQQPDTVCTGRGEKLPPGVGIPDAAGTAWDTTWTLLGSTERWT